MRTVIAFAIMIAVLTGGCAANKAQNGALLGSLAGATVGALTFKNKISGAAIGAGTGLLVGYIAGNEMDKMDAYDQGRVADTLETTPSGHQTHWVNPDTRTYYEAVPQPGRQGALEPLAGREQPVQGGRETGVHRQLHDGLDDLFAGRAHVQPWECRWRLLAVYRCLRKGRGRGERPFMRRCQ